MFQMLLAKKNFKTSLSWYKKFWNSCIMWSLQKAHYNAFYKSTTYRFHHNFCIKISLSSNSTFLKTFWSALICRNNAWSRWNWYIFFFYTGNTLYFILISVVGIISCLYIKQSWTDACKTLQSLKYWDLVFFSVWYTSWGQKRVVSFTDTL